VAGSGDSGLSAHVAGPAASAADSVKIFKGIGTTLLYATLAVVIVLLLLTYRSPVLWVLPILSAGLALTALDMVAEPAGQAAGRRRRGPEPQPPVPRPLTAP
jgi:RND superfamily putative drug exporter